MKEPLSLVFSVILAAAMMIVVMCLYGTLQFSQDQYNIENAIKTFVDRVVDSDVIEDYYIAELNSQVSATNGTYSVRVTKKSVVRNPVPDIDGSTYETEYIGNIKDKLNTGDRIRVEVTLISYPSAMTLMSGIFGHIGNRGNVLYDISGKVR